MIGLLCLVEELQEQVLPETELLEIIARETEIERSKKRSQDLEAENKRLKKVLTKLPLEAERFLLLSSLSLS